MENENLSVIRKFVEEGFGNADLYIIDHLMSENCIEHQFGMSGQKEGLKKAVLSLKLAFTDLDYELIRYCTDGNIVWVHYKATGTHTGPFMGNEATGRKFSIDVMDVVRIDEGQITEHWGVPDRFALLTQLRFIQSTLKINK